MYICIGYIKRTLWMYVRMNVELHLKDECPIVDRNR